MLNPNSFTDTGIPDALRSTDSAALASVEGEDSWMESVTLELLDSELRNFLSEFDSCFRSRPTRGHLHTYVRGQLGPLERKCVEPMALEAGLAPRTLQQFLGLHNWSEDAMRAKVRTIVAREYGDPDAVGVIDETSFEKKGHKTAGVHRQYCGSTGKIDNCVQTVHLSYVNREFSTIVDGDLYLPESWCDDIDRRREAGVPESLTFRTKLEIAIDLLDRSARDGVVPRWITADEFYGRSSAFRGALEDRGLLYVLEVPVSTCGWTPRALARGHEHRRVDALFKRGGPSWHMYNVKETTKGPLVWRARATRVVLHAGTDRSEKWLIIASNPLTEECKYFVSNAATEVTVDALLSVAFRRWHVERNFQDSKQEIGLGDFEVRTYKSLQRHLAISMVSVLFLVRTKTLLNRTVSQGWTVPQVQAVVNVIVDTTRSPEAQARQLAHVLNKVAYWQRRSAVAAKCHRVTRIARLAAAGIDVEKLKPCPAWLN